MMYNDLFSIETDLEVPEIVGRDGDIKTFTITKCTGAWNIVSVNEGLTFSKTSGSVGESIQVSLNNVSRISFGTFFILDYVGMIPISFTILTEGSTTGSYILSAYKSRNFIKTNTEEDRGLSIKTPQQEYIFCNDYTLINKPHNENFKLIFSNDNLWSPMHVYTIPQASSSSEKFIYYENFYVERLFEVQGSISSSIEGGSIEFPFNTYYDNVKISNLPSWITSYSINNTTKKGYLNIAQNTGNSRNSELKWVQDNILLGTTDVTQEGISYYFNISPKTISVPYTGGKYKVIIDTNYTEFTNADIPSWITKFQYIPNQSGTINIEVAETPKANINSRTGEIKFYNGDTLLDTLTITQGSYPKYLDISPKTISIPVFKETTKTYKITVSTNDPTCTFTAPRNYSFPTTNFVRINIRQDTSIGDTTTKIFNVTVHRSDFAEKLPDIIFKASAIGLPTKTCVITQESAKPYISPSSSRHTVTVNNDVWGVGFKANFSDIVSPNNNTNGITYSLVSKTLQGTSGYYEYLYNFHALKNITSVDKVDYFNFTGQGLVHKHAVIRNANIRFDVVDPLTGNSIREYHTNSDSIQANFDIITNVGLKSIEFSDQWLSNAVEFTPSISNDLVTLRSVIKIEENQSEARVGTITFTSNKDQVITVTVYQEAGIIPTLEVTPSKVNLDSNAHTFELLVKATFPWSLYSISRIILPKWINLDKISGNAGDTTITVNVEQALLKSREVTLNFHLDEFSDITAQVNIVQKGIYNGYDITDIEDESDWSDRQETKIRDKYAKIKMRYSGNDLATITAVRTLYDTHFN